MEHTRQERNKGRFRTFVQKEQLNTFQPEGTGQEFMYGKDTLKKYREQTFF